MNNKILLANLSRIILFVLLQVLVLKQIPMELAGYHLMVFLYPVLLILLPLRMPKIGLLLTAFVLGLVLDSFYDSPGVHAGASVFTVFIRNFVFRIMDVDTDNVRISVASREYIGTGRFLRLVAVLLFFHILVYYIYDVFTFVYFKEIIVKTMGSFVVSMLLVLPVSFIFGFRR